MAREISIIMPGRRAAHFVARHVQKGQAAIEKDDDRQNGRDPLAARKGGRHEAQPHLDHGAIDQDRNRQNKTDPEAVAKQQLVTSVVRAVGRVRVVGRASVVGRGWGVERGGLPVGHISPGRRVSRTVGVVPVVDGRPMSGMALIGQWPMGRFSFSPIMLVHGTLLKPRSAVCANSGSC
jgi:hypothetical protein